jgi:hypothetical protein
MALNDKNLIITPNIGSTSEPKIDFVGASTNTGPSTITATIYSTNNGTISFDATEGSLFSIVNNLSTGSIFSVNPISGIPIIDVNADRTISLNPFGGNTGIGTTNPTSKLHVIGDARFTGVVTASSFSGNATSATYATSSGIATYATSAGIATYATTAGIATYATSAGIATYATYATNAGVSTYATSSGIATYATSSGIATYATSSGIATYATNAGASTSVIGGIASVTQLSVSGITTLGIVTAGNIFSTGIITATSYRGDGSLLTGISASGGIAISTNTTDQAQYITYTPGTGSTTGLGVTATGLVFNPFSDNLGIGTTNPTSTLHVIGSGRFTGVVTATSSSSTISGFRNVSISTESPTGGSDGDVWIKYIP